MMTADRTAIRRRLAVRRTAHRPPSRRAAGWAWLHCRAARGHPRGERGRGSRRGRPGAGRARPSRRRRAKAQRARERRFALLPGEPLRRGSAADGARPARPRDRAARGREAGVGAPDARAVHETRKALKRLRALIELLRDELGDKALRARERRSCATRPAPGGGTRRGGDGQHARRAARRSPPAKLARRRAVIELRAQLLAEREAATRTRCSATQAARGGGARRAARGLRERVARWSLPERPGIAVVADRPAEGSTGRGAAATGALNARRAPAGSAPRAARVAQTRQGPALRRRDARPAAALARRADALGELLGEEHDLALLAARVAAPGRTVRGQTRQASAQGPARS